MARSRRKSPVRTLPQLGLKRPRRQLRFSPSDLFAARNIHSLLAILREVLPSAVLWWRDPLWLAFALSPVSVTA